MEQAHAVEVACSVKRIVPVSMSQRSNALKGLQLMHGLQANIFLISQMVAWAERQRLATR